MNRELYEFGDVLTGILKDKGINQIELSNLTGLSQSYISQILGGKRSPNLHKLVLICDALKVSITSVLLKSIRFDNASKNKKKLELIEEIQPMLLKMDELIYPPDGSQGKKLKNSSPILPPVLNQLVSQD